MAVKATRFGRPLPDGGTIGVPAPASPYHNRSAALRGVEWWETRGYRVKLAENALARDHWVAGSAEARARDLTAMFADRTVDVVQCLQGGYGSAQLIPHLDFDAIAAHPKPFVGYSDITALHVALRQRAGLATFYGYGLVGMGDIETSEFSRTRWLATIGGATTGPIPPDPDDPYVRAIHGAVQRLRWSAAACGSSCRRWGRRGSSTRTAASSSSRTSTCPRGTWTDSSCSSCTPANSTESPAS
jgi:hypothetical protein